MLRYGLTLPNGGACGDPRFLVELAERAEAAGWDGLFLEDYVSYQGDPREATCDVWPALGAIALRTKRMILGTRSRRFRDAGRGTWRARQPPSTSYPMGGSCWAWASAT